MRLTSLFPLVVLPTLMMENENTIFPKMNFSQYFARQYFTQAFFLHVFGVSLPDLRFVRTGGTGGPVKFFLTV